MMTSSGTRPWRRGTSSAHPAHGAAFDVVLWAFALAGLTAARASLAPAWQAASPASNAITRRMRRDAASDVPVREGLWRTSLDRRSSMRNTTGACGEVFPEVSAPFPSTDLGCSHRHCGLGPGGRADGFADRPRPVGGRSRDLR